MLKKTILTMVTVLLVTLALLQFPGAAFAEGSDGFWFTGLVTEVEYEDLLITDESGRELRVIVDSDTLTDAELPILPGDWVRVRYDGTMSRELRGTLWADELRCHRLSGTVSAAEDGFLLHTEDGSVVTVLTSAPQEEGSRVTVFAADLAGGSITPFAIRGSEVSGTVAGLTDGGFLLDAGSETMTLLTDGDTLMAADLQPGTFVLAVVTGDRCTMVLPR